MIELTKAFESASSTLNYMSSANGAFVSKLTLNQPSNPFPFIYPFVTPYVEAVEVSSIVYVYSVVHAESL